MKLRLAATLGTAILLITSAVPAHADVTLTPFIGSLFKGDLPTNRFAYGGSITFTASGIFGGEIEGTFAPKFIEKTVLTPEVHHANVMGNLIVAIPIGGTSGKSVRPYVVGGIGLFRTTWKDSDFLDPIRSNDFAYNLGGGVMAFFSDAVGLRLDLRYFQALRNQDAGTGLSFQKGDLNFWRWSVGPSFKF
jgi:opacity protein-like surface antigen